MYNVQVIAVVVKTEAVQKVYEILFHNFHIAG